VFWDHGPGIEGGPPGTPDADGDRYIEIWNLVFMQFNRDESGTLHPLPKPSVDTGMGLERVAAVLQGVHSNYEIDLFQDLIEAAARATGTRDLTSNSLKVIADHIRACSFLVTDGVIPGNEGRGYVLRRIIRRAIRHGYKLGQKQPFFHTLVDDLAKVMGEAYPELVQDKTRVAGVLRQEEERFAETLDNGMGVLESALHREDRMLDGETVFKLYDTYGFPVDLTADIARERGFQVDLAGFEAAMGEQRERARAASRFHMQTAVGYRGQATQFQGYTTLKLQGRILALYQEGSEVNSIQAGDEAVIVLDRTPFYAESGGQVGDSGQLVSGHGIFEVQDTQKIQAEVYGHRGVLKTGRLTVSDEVSAQVNAELRARAAYNHSATHLMHAALRQVLGKHVQQKGSLVDAWKTRFDFSHDKPMTAEEIREVERLVNEQIRRNHAVEARLMKYDEAIKHGAMALFGEKYGDEVRVIGMGEFSTELCGGTHVARTGDIGAFVALGDSASSAGVRRIEALTGQAALDHLAAQAERLAEVAGVLKAQPGDVAERVRVLMDERRALQNEVAQLRRELAMGGGGGSGPEAREINGIRFIPQIVSGVTGKDLPALVDDLKGRVGSGVVLVVADTGGKAAVAAGVTADLTARLSAVDVARAAAEVLGGKGGGGRADLAQAGGSDPSRANEAIAAAESVIGAVA
jgi:alanyl-tRNA synthetase